MTGAIRNVIVTKEAASRMNVRAVLVTTIVVVLSFWSLLNLENLATMQIQETLYSACKVLILI